MCFTVICELHELFSYISCTSVIVTWIYVFACFSWPHWALAHPRSLFSLTGARMERFLEKLTWLPFDKNLDVNGLANYEWLYFWGILMYLLKTCDVRLEWFYKEVTFLYIDFYYWLITFKFKFDSYWALVRARQAFRRYSWVRPRKKWGHHIESFIERLHDSLKESYARNKELKYKISFLL